MLAKQAFRLTKLARNFGGGHKVYEKAPKVADEMYSPVIQYLD